MELFPLVIANMLGVVAGAAEDIALARTLSTAEIEDGLRELRRWSERPDAALWYAVPYAAAVRPG
jgi:hypothetical protein